jgi:hypothetical protein
MRDLILSGKAGSLLIAERTVGQQQTQVIVEKSFQVESVDITCKEEEY